MPERKESAIWFMIERVSWRRDWTMASPWKERGFRNGTGDKFDTISVVFLCLLYDLRLMLKAQLPFFWVLLAICEVLNVRHLVDNLLRRQKTEVLNIE